mmetsp:Transcript_44375/g.108956  ORF Transcript_44375/g.108956 Transcript_44375/m.108956 type:complete len:97 (-) Transcript_44375:891-1181(-)
MGSHAAYDYFDPFRVCETSSICFALDHHVAQRYNALLHNRGVHVVSAHGQDQLHNTIEQADFLLVLRGVPRYVSQSKTGSCLKHYVTHVRMIAHSS